MENLLQRRLALGLSKRKVAKLTNLSRRTVLNAENGSNITMKTYSALDYLYSKLEAKLDANQSGAL